MSAKFIMRYFATADDQVAAGKKKKTDGSMTEVEEQILGKIHKELYLTYQLFNHTYFFFYSYKSNYGSIW